MEEMRFDLGSERWMGLLKADIGQIDVSGRKNVSRLLYSKHVFKVSFTSASYIQASLSKFFLHKLGYGQRSRDVEAIVLKTWWLVSVLKREKRGEMGPAVFLPSPVLLVIDRPFLQTLLQLCCLSPLLIFF